MNEIKAKNAFLGVNNGPSQQLNDKATKYL